jgi:predicted lipoprotein with Yx(FWY)xxD motif
MRMPALGASMMVAAAGFGAGTASAYTAPYSTPEGIMIVDVMKLMDDAIPQYLWRRLGDASGNPLYTYDADQNGRSSCYAECAKEFPPFVADGHARGGGDFSIIVRDDHVRQWAYQGKPLYRYSGKDPDGEPVGARIELKEDPAWVDPASKFFSPKLGWRRAAYTPEKSTVMPSSMELAAIAAANGFGFIDAATHMTIYAAPIAHVLSGDWQPVRASALALPVGAFSVITRSDDGTLQWAYRGEALYTYGGDYAPGEANGIFTDDRSVHAALAYRNFAPAQIQVAHYPGRSPLLTNLKGQPLYFESRYHLQYGGRETREGYVITYNDAKAQGAEACQADCIDSWKPVLASSKDKGWGFWEPIARPDGAMQWAFKGCPVYTFVGDQKPGDVEGNNRYVIVFGGDKGQFTYSNPGRDPHNPQAPQPHLGNLDMAQTMKAMDGPGGGAFEEKERPGAGYYWHTTGLFY